MRKFLAGLSVAALCGIAVPVASAGPTRAAKAPSAAAKSWTLPNASGLTGQQQLYRAYIARNPGTQLPKPAGGTPSTNF